MAQGKVKFFNGEKGYGFITPTAGGKDIFVHHTSIKMEGYRKLDEGDEVEYQIEQGDRGPSAVNVTKI